MIYQRVKTCFVELYLEVEDADESEIESTGRWTKILEFE